MALTKVHSRITETNILNVKDFGAGPTKTDAENKAIIDGLIDDCVGDLYSSFIVVPNDCEYGYDFRDPDTFLTKTNEDASCFVHDYTNGSVTNAAGLPSFGSQVRTWMFARGLVEQNGSGTGIGNTAGNSTVIHGLWNPGLVMNVNGENIDNRRVKIFWGALGENYWSAGMGNQTIAYSAGEPDSNEKRRRHFNIAGKTNDVTSYQNKYVIRQDNGNHGWNIAEPTEDYQFCDNSNVTGQVLMELKQRQSAQAARFRVDTPQAYGEIRVNDDYDVELRFSQDGSDFISIVDDGIDRFLFNTNAVTGAFQIRSSGEVASKSGVNGGAFTTAERNALSGLLNGTMVFDTTLDKPIWYNSGAWVDATGSSV